MGQYHTIYNKTKNEMIRIGGSKLWEQAHSATAAALLLLFSNSNGRGGGDFNTYPEDYDKLTAQEIADDQVISLVAGRWAGDSIVVQGDYAEETDPSFITLEEFKNYEDITSKVCDALLIADGGSNSEVVQIIENEAKMGFGTVKNISVEKVESLDRNKRTVEKYQAAGLATPKPKRKANVVKLKARGVK